MAIDKLKILENQLWNIEDKIDKNKDDSDRKYLEILNLKDRIKKIENRITKINSKIYMLSRKSKIKVIELKIYGKIDNFLTKNLVKVNYSKYNYPGMSYHYRLKNDKGDALIIDNEYFLEKLLKTVTIDEIKRGVVLRIKRSAKNRYSIWVKRE